MRDARRRPLGSQPTPVDPACQAAGDPRRRSRQTPGSGRARASTAPHIDPPLAAGAPARCRASLCRPWPAGQRGGAHCGVGAPPRPTARRARAFNNGLAAARGTSPAPQRPWRALMPALIAEAASTCQRPPIVPRCHLLSRPRAGYDRGAASGRTPERDQTGRDHLQGLALELPA